MRSITEIDADFATLGDRVKAIKDEKTRRLEEFNEAFDAEFHDEAKQLSERRWALELEKSQVLAATVAHPLEGKKVFMMDSRRIQRSFRTKQVKLFGVVKAIRTDDDVPERLGKRHIGEYHPKIGDVIIQRVNDNSKVLKGFVKVSGADLPRGWFLVEETVA